MIARREYAQRHAAPLRELDPISNQIEKDLAQPVRVATIASRDRGIDVLHELQSLGARPGARTE